MLLHLALKLNKSIKLVRNKIPYKNSVVINILIPKCVTLFIWQVDFADFIIEDIDFHLFMTLTLLAL